MIVEIINLNLIVFQDNENDAKNDYENISKTEISLTGTESSN